MKEESFMPLMVLIISILFALLLISFFRIDIFRSTGLTIKEPLTFTETINLLAEESLEHEWQPENQGQLVNAKISGVLRLQEGGYVRVYLEDKLILDSSQFDEQDFSITGMAIEDKENKTKEKKEKNKTKEKEEGIQELKNITEENVTEENITEVNITNETIENETIENITEPEPIPEIQIRELDFSHICIETCDLDLNKESYNLKFEVENATINLESVTYTILKKIEKPLIENITNLTNVTNITNITEINITNVTNFTNITLLEAKIKFIDINTGEVMLTKNASSKKKDSLTVPVPELARGFYNVEIEPVNHTIRKILFKKVDVSDQLLELVKLDEVPAFRNFVQVYAIDPTMLNFTEGTVTVVAKGELLYKCKDWDFEEQECYGTWDLLRDDLVPGKEYSFVLTPEDPAYSETFQPNATEGIDTYINQKSSGSNYGNDVDLMAGESGGKYMGILIKFSNISNIPPYSTVTSAKLKLYFYDSTGNPTSAVNLSTRRILSEWYEENVTWATRPNYTTGYSDIVTLTNNYGWVVWDVTDGVQGIVNGTHENYGTAIVPDLESANTEKIFHSSDYSNASLRPILEVNYTTTTTPNVTIVWPENNTQHGNGTLVIAYRVDGEVEIDNCSLINTNNGNVLDTQYNVVRNVTTGFNRNIATEGNYKVHINCTDSSGHWGSSEVLYFTVNASKADIYGKVKDANGSGLYSNISFKQGGVEKYSSSAVHHALVVDDGVYNITIEVNQTLETIEFNNVNIINNLLKIIDVDEPEEKKGYTKLYAIDPTALNFDHATVRVIAKDTKAYKCQDWNFSGQVCDGDWVLFRNDLVLGQEYEFILTAEDPGYGEIWITNAEHLNQSRDFISNIYNEVNALDDVWSEEIYHEEYVRVVFKAKLSSKNDITVYVRNNQSLNTTIEVYYFNSSEKITEFPVINETKYYRVVLAGMNGEHDTFDLRIKNLDDNSSAYLEFDHIIDPTIQHYLRGEGGSGDGFKDDLRTVQGGNTATWSSLGTGAIALFISEAYSTNTELPIQSFPIGIWCYASGSAGGSKVYIVNYKLYNCSDSSCTSSTQICDAGGSLNLVCTSETPAFVTSSACSIASSYTIPSGQYLALELLSYNSKTPYLIVAYNSSTRDSHVNVTEEIPDDPPNVTALNYPNDNDNLSSIPDFNYTVQDDWGFTNCTLWANFSGSWAANETNSSAIQNNTVNKITVSSLDDGTWLWNVKCWDNKSTPQYDFYDSNYTFTLDSTTPNSVTLNEPIDNYNSSASVLFNCSATDNVNLANISLWHNTTSWHKNATNTSASGTSSTVTFSVTFAEGNYLWSCSACDTLNNCNESFTENRTLTVDTTPPTVTLPIYTNGTQKTAAESLNINASVSDAGGGADSCEINVETATQQNVTVSVNNGWCNYSYSLAGASEGNQTINVYANDTVGNWALNDSYVVDIIGIPPNVTALNYPTNNSNQTSMPDFNYTVQDDYGFTNCTLWANFTGSWEANEINSSAIVNDSVNTITVSSLDDGIWLWNVKCWDNAKQSDFYTYNYTFNFTLNTSVTNCTDITSPGTYYLQNDIPNSSDSPCIIISANNVVFDCQGYNVDGIDGATTRGIWIQRASQTDTNITVKNCNVSDWYYGVSSEKVSNNTLTNNTLNSNTWAIYLSYGNNNTLVNNTASDNSQYSFRFDDINNSNIINNTMNNAMFGIYLNTDCNNNNFTNNIFNNMSGDGIFLQSSNNNIFTNNTCNGFNYGMNNGVYIWGGSNNTFTNLTISGASSGGFYFLGMQPTINNIIIDSKISGNYSDAGYYDVYSQIAANNNTFLNTTYNKSAVNIANGVVYFKWYLDVYVNDTSGTPIPDANATAWDINSVKTFTELTNSTGWIERQNLTEYYQNSTGEYYSTNYTMNTTKIAYTTDSREFNLTASRIEYVTLAPHTPTHDNPIFSPSPPNTGQNLTILNQSTSDPDGDVVYNIYDFRTNNSGGDTESLAVANTPFDTNFTIDTNALIRDYSSFENNLTESGLGGAQHPKWANATECNNNMGGCYYFDGDNDVLQYASDDDFNLTNLTIELWFNTSKDFTTLGVLWEDEGNDIGRIYMGSDEKISFQAKDTGGTRTVTSLSAVNDSQWHHIVVRKVNNSYIDLWLDGVFQDDNSFGPQATPTIGCIPSIGTACNSPVYDYEGYIDNIIVYDYAIDNETIVLHNSSKPVNNISGNEFVVNANVTGCVTPTDSEFEGLTKCVSETATGVSDNPPEVTALNYPTNNSNFTSIPDFNYTVTDDFNFTNCTLWANFSGSWVANETNSSAIQNNTVNKITVSSLDDGTWLWNVKCWDNASSPQSDFYTDNYTFRLDTTPPTVANTAVNDTSVSPDDYICVNATAIDSTTAIDKVWALITFPNNTVENYSAGTEMSDSGSCAGSPGDDWYSVDINVGSTEGNLTVNTTYANDTLSNQGNQTPWPNLQVVVTAAAAEVNISFVPPTPGNDTRQIANSVVINVSVNGTNDIDTCTITWDNSTHTNNYTMTKVGSGTEVFCNFSNATVDGTSYWYLVYANDTGGVSNVTDNRTFRENAKPSAVSLLKPDNENHTTNRQPTFNWSASSDDDSDTLTYQLNITPTCNTPPPDCDASDLKLINITDDTNHTLTAAEKLKNLYESPTYQDYYNWTLLAWDGYEWSNISDDDWRLFIDSEVMLTLINDTINFGNMSIFEENDTTDDSPYPLLLQNDGNCYVDVNFSASDWLWDTVTEASDYFQFKIDNYSTWESFNWSGSLTDWENVSLDNVTAIKQLNYTTGNNRSETDIYVKVPGEELPGTKNSTVVFTGYYVQDPD